MFLIDFLRFMSGFVEFTATGGFGERFINLCSVHDIPLWNLNYNDDYFTACTTIAGYKKIAVCSRNSGVKIRKKKSVGIPFILNRLRPRIGILIGSFFFIICFMFLSGKVWRIEVSGNTAVPTDTILSAAENAGLKIGVKSKDLNVVQISLDTCENIKNLSWAAIRVTGSCVYIDVTESKPAKQVENKKGLYNLVSSKDAQLIILEPYSGTVQAKTLNSVLKGDILISGTVQNRNESVSFVHASGYAVGRTENTISVKTNRTLTTCENTLLKRVYVINFFGFNIPLWSTPVEYDKKFEHSRFLSFDGKTLPIGISYTEYYVCSQGNKTISQKQAEQISMSKFMNEVNEFSYGKQIIENKISFDNKNCAVSGDFICYENIGIETPFEIEKTQQEIP